MENKKLTLEQQNQIEELRKKLQILVGTDKMSPAQARAIYKKAKEDAYKNTPQQELPY